MSITGHTQQHTDSTISTAASLNDARVWSVDQVRALGATTTLATAASVLGISKSLAYRLAAINTFPTPVIRLGTRIRVPVDALVRLLVANDDPEPAAADGGPLDAGGEVSVDATTSRPADSTPYPCLCRIRTRNSWRDDH
jgi:hypothetical protein